MGELIIGKHTYGTVSRRGNMNNVTIGKFCSIAQNVVVDGGFNHNTEWLSTYPFNSCWGVDVPHNAVCKGDITIGNDVWIGENVLIMSGVTIGDGAVIGANSVVTKDVYSYTIFAGTPAKYRKDRFGIYEQLNLLNMKWWDWENDKIKEAAKYLMSNDIEELINYYKTNIENEGN